jgi:general secretion pathway protein B
MSLILEALRKSEAERQRGQVPSLFDAAAAALPAAPKHPGRALWWAVPVALSAALLMLWRYAPAPVPDAPAPLDAGADGGAARMATVTVPEHRTSGPVVAPRAAEAAAQASGGPATSSAPRPASVQPAQPEPPRPGRPESALAADVSAEAGPRGRVAPPADTAVPPHPAATPATALISAPARLPASLPSQPATAEPARPHPDAGEPAVTASDRATEPRSTAGAEPPPLRLADLTPAQRRSLPPLKMSMHLWSADAAQRFVILDGGRMGEGDRIGEAVIDEITRDGAILVWNGRRVVVPLR